MFRKATSNYSTEKKLFVKWDQLILSIDSCCLSFQINGWLKIESISGAKATDSRCANKPRFWFRSNHVETVYPLYFCKCSAARNFFSSQMIHARTSTVYKDFLYYFWHYLSLERNWTSRIDLPFRKKTEGKNKSTKMAKCEINASVGTQKK